MRSLQVCLADGDVLTIEKNQKLSELLIDVVDFVLEGSGIDEKFLGITLFALVPNTTEFMNAISFALHENIALRFVVDWCHNIVY